MARRRNVVEHAKYIAQMAGLLAERIESREGTRSTLGTYPDYGYFGVDAFNSPTNLERMIVQLRVELLELKKEL